MILFLLLRIVYKPFDASFLNNNSINVKKYLGDLDDISSEKIIIDVDLFKNSINFDFGQITLKKYNHNISNITAANVSITIKITDLFKDKINADSLNIANGNLDYEDVTNSKKTKENLFNILSNIPINKVNFKNININVYKKDSRIAVINNINGGIKKNSEKIVFKNFNINYIEYIDNKKGNKFIVNNLFVSNEYVNNYIIAIDNLDLSNNKSLIEIQHIKSLKNIAIKDIVINYNTENSQVNLDGNILFNGNTSQLVAKGVYANKNILETLVKINLKSFPVFTVLEESIFNGEQYNLQNINNLNFNGNIYLNIVNNKLSNINLDIKSNVNNSDNPIVLKIKSKNNFKVNEIILNANYKNKKIKIEKLEIKSPRGNINLKGDIKNLNNTVGFNIKLGFSEFQLSNLVELTYILFPEIIKYKEYYKNITKSYINNLILNIEKSNNGLKVFPELGMLTKTDIALKNNLILSIPEINIKSNKNKIILNFKSSKIHNNITHANLAKTRIVLNSFNQISDINNKIEVTTSIKTKYHFLYELINLFEKENINKTFIKNINGDIDGFLYIKRDTSLDVNKSLSYEFSAKLTDFNLLESDKNKKSFISFNDFQGDFLFNNEKFNIVGKTLINGSLSNVNILLENRNKIIAHIDSDAKASSFNFLKQYNYIKEGSNKLEILITKDINSKNWIAEVKSNLFASDVELNFMNYRKVKNTRGHLTATFYFTGNQLNKIESLNFVTDKVIMKGNLGFDDNVKLRKIEIEEYISDKNNFTALLDTSINGDSIINIKGSSINLENFFDNSNKKFNNLLFSLNIKTLFYGDRSLGETKLKVEIKNGSLLDLKGEIFHNGKSYLRFFDIGLKENKLKKVLFKFDDLGLFLAETKISDSFIKGKGNIYLYINKYDLSIDSGNIDISDSSIRNASFLARLLQLASFTGLLEILTNEGIPFSKIEGDFFVKNNRINVKSIKFKGFSLGGTIKGNIKLNTKSIDLEGVIVPAYAINALINKIPIVGQIITGIEGEGLIGVNYSAKGTFDKPDYSINPLSILTPGIIRNIFDTFKSDKNQNEAIE